MGITQGLYYEATGLHIESSYQGSKSLKYMVFMYTMPQ